MKIQISILLLFVASSFAQDVLHLPPSTIRPEKKPAPCSEQTLNNHAVEPFFIGGIQTLDGLGYRNPGLTLSGGVDLEATHFFATASGNLGWTRKIETGNGISSGGAFGMFGKLHRTLWGAGDTYSILSTSQWSKGGHRPWIGAGYDGTGLRWIGRYETAWLDSQNALQGFKSQLEMEANSHLRVVFTNGIYRYHDTRVPGVAYLQPAQHHWGGNADFQLKWAF